MRLAVRRQVNEIVAEALRRNRDQRREYISSACPTDDIRLRVEEFLQQLDEAPNGESFGGGPSPIRGKSEQRDSSTRPDAEDTSVRRRSAGLSTMQPGTRFEGYRILHMIDQGGMGVVYCAQEISHLERKVALKVIRRDRLERPESGRRAVQRFFREGRMIAKAAGAHVVPIYDMGTAASGEDFIVMHWIDGPNLAQRIKESGRQVSPRQAARYMIQVSQAVQWGHARGVVHRDLKPKNLLLDSDDKIWVADFGLAVSLEHQMEGAASDERPNSPACHHAVSSGVAGTPGFMAPEQAAGELVTTATDVYGLGATLYALLVGEAPGKQLVSPRDRNPAVSRDLNAICLRCLQLEPEERYQTAQEFGDDLQRYLNHYPVAARPVGWLQHVGAACRRHPFATLATAMAVSAACALIVISVLHYRYVERSRRELATSQTKIRQVVSLMSRTIDGLYKRAIDDFPTLPEGYQTTVRKEAVRLAEDLQTIDTQDPAIQVLRAEVILRAGNLSRVMGEREAGVAEFERAVQIGTQLLDQFPEEHRYRRLLAGAYNDLGIARAESDELDAAQADYTKAVDFYECLIEETRDPQDKHYLAASLNNLATLLDRASNDAADEARARCFEIRRELIEEHPNVAEYQAGWATVLNNRALRMMGRGEFESSIGELQRAIEAYETALESQVDNLGLQYRLAACAYNLGMVTKRVGDNAQAMDWFVKAERRTEPLVRDYPNHREYREVWLRALNSQALLLRNQQNLDAAEALFEKVLGRLQPAYDANPSDPRLVEPMATVLNNMSQISLLRKDFGTCVLHRRQVVELRRQLVQAAPDAVDYRLELGKGLVNLGQACLEGNQDLDQGTQAAREAVDVLNSLPASTREEPASQEVRCKAHAGLAQLLVAQGMMESGVHEMKEAISLASRSLRPTLEQLLDQWQRVYDASRSAKSTCP